MRRHGHPEQEAVRRAEREERGLARASHGLNEDTKRYIHGLKIWNLANYFWSLRCRRFIVGQVEEAARCLSCITRESLPGLTPSHPDGP